MWKYMHTYLYIFQWLKTSCHNDVALPFASSTFWIWWKREKDKINIWCCIWFALNFTLNLIDITTKQIILNDKYFDFFGIFISALACWLAHRHTDELIERIVSVLFWIILIGLWLCDCLSLSHKMDLDAFDLGMHLHTQYTHRSRLHYNVWTMAYKHMINFPIVLWLRWFFIRSCLFGN